MFISRVELLPEDETTAQHDEAKRIEAQLIESDRATRANGEPGLFKGVFSRTRLGFGGVIRDEEDGVDRCPICAWEMEDGECGHCGYLDHDEAWSDEEEHEDGTIDSQSVISIQSSTMDGGDDPRDNPFLNHLLGGQAPSIPDDFREWERRDQAARLARRTMRGVERHRRYGTASTADTHDYLMDHYEEHSEDSAGSEGDDEIAAFLERHPIDDTRWDTSTAETVDEDEEMTSAMDDEDAESAESTTSFHRAAILARDNGMNPPFSSDISTNASDGEEDGETATHDSNGSDESERSEDDEDTPEATPTVHRLANRPARIIIDSEDESDEDGSSSEEDDEDNEGDEEEDEDGETDDDSTPSPPRPAAARQARVQMHRGRRGTRGRGRGRGRPRTRG